MDNFVPGIDLPKTFLTDAFDALILDDSSYTESAIEICKLFRKLFDCPILLLTSNQDEQYWLDVYSAGIDECIVHPLSPELLTAKVAAWIRWR
jgi:DNA-binding response OmpR family regulator